MSARKTHARVRLFCPNTDLGDVLEIEHGSFEHPWETRDFRNHLRQTNCFGIVAEFNGRIVGYAICHLEKTGIHIVNLAVAPDARHCDVGTRLMGSILNRSVRTGRTSLSLIVDRKNVGAVRFFRFHCFKVIRLRRQFSRTHEDAWIMKYEFTNEELHP